jgi:hypothetical protein
MTMTFRTHPSTADATQPYDPEQSWLPQESPPVRTGNRVEFNIGFSLPPHRGDARAQEDYDRAAALDEDRQAVEWQVKRECTVQAVDGRTITGGMAVTLADVGGSWATMQHLADRGAVCHVGDPSVLAARNCPTDARFVVGANSGIICARRGVLGPGEPCTPEDFGRDAVPARPETPPQVLLSGRVIPGIEALPAEPAHDGMTVLTELVRRGLIIDRQATAAARAGK